MKSLDGQVALVTGASRGIGRAVALALADLGAQIVAAARNRQLLDQLVAEIEEAGGKAAAVVFDLADESTINALVEQVKSQFGRLDILVNNAGLTHSAPLEETTTADFDRIMAVNARGPYILTRQCLPLLKAAPQATIVNISSVVGVKGYPKQSAYTASKHALRGWSIALAEELRGTNVRVHVLCPGGVDTDMVGNVRPDI
ncbi:MAG: SDR family NAD(P)-dependent oxidoreductase, partial [Planctomycetota bacterium]